MKPRIETAEVVASRLKVPLNELEHLAEGEAGRELGLTLEYDGNELVLACAHGESALRFRPIGEDAMLSELALSKDEDGAFLETVVVPLMARFKGDLEIRLVWNETERNTQGDHAAVKITRGVLDTGQRAQPAQLPSGSGAAEVESSEAEPPLTPEEREIGELVERARAHWAEYQKLKSGK